MVTANSGLSTNRTHHRSRGCCPWTQQRTVASDRPRLSPLCSLWTNVPPWKPCGARARPNTGWRRGRARSSWPLTAGGTWPVRGTSIGTGPGCRNGGIGSRARARPGWSISPVPDALGGFPPLQQTQIVALACTPPDAAGRAWVRWSVQALHDEIERRQIATLHPSTVQRVLAAVALHPHHIRYWRHAIAPDFEEKAASVLWYYERIEWLATQDELVVCLDEKTQIQALRRPLPDLGMRPGRDLRREWEYKREGTVNLLMTYVPITGRVWGQVVPKNDHPHFLEALSAFLAEIPRTIRRIHCILDNGPSHIAKETRAWVARQRGRVVFHFTPPHASWLNQAELALSAFSRRYLRTRVSESRADLIAHIHRALHEYNHLFARPFSWSFTRPAMHEWYCRRTSAMVH